MDPLKFVLFLLRALWPALLIATSARAVILVETRSIRGAQPGVVEVAVPGGASWTASTSGAAWLRVLTPSGNAGDMLRIEVTPGSLAPNLYTGTVSLAIGALSDSASVRFTIEAPAYAALMADPDRPRLYALQRTAALSSSVAVINTATSAVERVIPVSNNATDFDLTPDNAYLYVIARASRKLHRVNLTDWTLAERTLGTSTDTSGTNVRFRVAAGAGSKVYWVDGEWAPRLHTLDFATGAESGSPIIADGNYGFGEIARMEGGAKLAAWSQLGWSAGSGISTSVSVNAAGASAAVLSTGISLARDPLESPVIARPDGSAVFMKQYKLRTDLASIIREYPGEVYAVTKTPNIVFGARAAWREWSGTQVWQAPVGVNASIIAAAGDQSAFFYFNTATATLVRVAMNSLGPFPENGEIITEMPAGLAWTPNTQAIRYEVYFGTDQAGVTAATGSSSPHFIGSSTTTSLPIDEDYRTGGVWWWRVDTVLAGSTVKGTVWRFSGALEYITMLNGANTDNVITNPQHTSLAMEGTTVMAGFPYGIAGSTPRHGEVRIFMKRRGAEEWYLHQKITKPASAGSGAEFGASIAMKGEVAWIGASRDSGGGRAYEYKQDPPTGLWQATGRRLQSPAPEAGDLFASSLSFDGTTLAVAMPGATVSTRATAGAVELFDVSNLSRILRITAQTPVAAANYGSTVALGSDFVAIGNPSLSAASGTADVWTRGTSGWSRTATLAQAAVGFGSSLAVSGNALYVTAPSGNAGQPAGKVYDYRRSGTGSWVLSAQFPSTGPAVTYGNSIAASGNEIAVGSFSDFGGSDPGRAGTVWLHRSAPDGSWTPVAPAEPVTSGDLFSTYGSRVALTNRYLAAVMIKGNGQPVGIHLFLHNPAANLPPFYTSAPVLFAEEGQPYNYPLAAADEDANDTLGFTAVSTLPAWLTLTNDTSGRAVLTGTPPAGAAGVITVSIEVRDAAGAAARQTFTLRILPPGGIPVITSSPENGTVNDGRRVEFTATVSPGGTLTYQWYRNGVLLPGETGTRLVIQNAQLSDAGNYTLRATRDGIAVDSAPLQLTVNQVPDRFGGDWPTFGGGMSRTGGYPATLGRHKFLPAWTVNPIRVNQVATSAGRVFATYTSTAGASVAAYSLQSGVRQWVKTFSSSAAINPPAFFRGRIYFMRGRDNTSTFAEVRCHDAAMGDLLWNAQTTDQSGTYYAPAVDETGSYFSGGYSGGLYRFLPDGTQEYFLTLESFDRWTPMLHQGGVYSFVAGKFRRHDPLSGAAISTISLPWQGVNGRMETVPAAEGNTVILNTQNELNAFNLTTGQLLWKTTRAYSWSPAIRNGIVYAIRDKTVESFNAVTGAPIRTYNLRTAAGVESSGIHQPIVLDDALVVSSATTTFIFDLVSGTLLQSLAGGGPLTYTDGYLMAASEDSATLRAWAVNQPSVITPPEPVIAATEDVPFTWEIAVTDPDSDVPAVTFTGLPSWLTASPLQAGVVRLTGAPLNQHAGAFSFRIRADDTKSFPAELTVTGSVAAVNDTPQAAAIPPITLDEDSLIATLNLRTVFRDEEDLPAGLTFRIRENSNSALLSGTVITDGNLILTAAPDANGTTILTLEATDSGGLTVETAYRLTLLPVNDTPRITPPAPLTVDEDAVILPLDLRSVFVDVEDSFEMLTLSISNNSNPALFSNAGLSGDTLQLTPTPDAFGTAFLSLRATDSGGLTAEAVVTVNIGPVPDAPRPVPNPPVPQIPADGTPFTFDTSALFTDPDPGERLRYSIEGNDRPELFHSLAVNAETGLLLGEWTPYVWGTATVTLRATGSDGLSLDSIVTLSLAEPPAPEWTLIGAATLNRQTGLLEQRVTLRNTGPRAIAGAELWLTPGDGTLLYNGLSRPPAGTPSLLPYAVPLGAGQSVTLVMEFYHPARRASFTVAHSDLLNPLAPPYASPPATGAPLGITSVLPVSGGMLIEFPSIPGAGYRIEYSPDNMNWSVCPIPITAGGTAVQWIDRGPPFTQSAPDTERQRFYRVRKLRGESSPLTPSH